MSPRSKRRAVVLLSGGLDSATTLYVAKAQGYNCRALILDYGQKHRREIRSARAVARSAGCPLLILKIPFPWGGSALTDHRMDIPKGRFRRPAGRSIPVTYVPARNTIFLSLALGYAEAIGAGAVFIGANAVDFSGYPDCRPVYYRAMERVFRLGTKVGVSGRPIRIITPLIHKSKEQIIRLGKRLGVPFNRTWSCYTGGPRSCSRCDSCLIRARGFKRAGLADSI